MAKKLVCLNYAKFVWPKGFKAKLDLLIKVLQTKTKRELAEVNIVLVEAATIKHLNYLYRKHNRVTDVLSFIYEAKPAQGDIIICLPQARRQARRYGNSLPQEVIKLVIHGGLHLLGYDHMRPGERKVMRTLEKQIGKQFGL